jgi:hypothetical protein
VGSAEEAGVLEPDRGDPYSDQTRDTWIRQTIVGSDGRDPYWNPTRESHNPRVHLGSFLKCSLTGLVAPTPDYGNESRLKPDSESDIQTKRF